MLREIALAQVELVIVQKKFIALLFKIRKTNN
jgi:hypothetical protein